MTVINNEITWYCKYDENIIKHLQEILLTMLKDFDEICKNNDINYFIYFGTNIGAVRHGGFIPWDDEIDIGLFREDYEKLIKILDKGTEKYYIYNWKHRFGVDNSCYTPKTLFCLKNTRLKFLLMDYGIYIDLNVLDDLPENKTQNFIFIKTLDLIYSVFNIARIVDSDVYISKNKEKIGHFFRFVFNHINIPNFFAKIFTRLIKKFHGKSNNVCNTNSLYYIPMSKKYFSKMIPIKFEDMIVNMPCGYDEILRLVYGDYMEIPPEEERLNHNWEIIDFGEY